MINGDHESEMRLSLKENSKFQMEKASLNGLEIARLHT